MKNKGTTGVSFSDAIRHHTKGLESIEITTLLRKRGRWLVIVQKTALPQVREQLAKHILQTLESRGNPTNSGIPIIIAGSLISKTTVGNYTTILKTYLTPKLSGPNK